MRSAIAIALILSATPAMAAEKPRETVKCLESRAMLTTRMDADRGYFARTSRGWYRNAGPACTAWAQDRAVRTFSTSNRQCAGDAIQIFHVFTRIDYGSCALGDWVPIDKAEAPPPYFTKTGK